MKSLYYVVVYADGSSDIKYSKKEAKDEVSNHPGASYYEAVVYTDSKLDTDYSKEDSVASV